MGWILLASIIGVLLLAILGFLVRRRELRKMAQRISDLEQAKATGTHRARLQYPYVDLSRCLGCGTCVRACPEDGVLDLIHGQAVVIHGARCVGHGLCAQSCPVGAIDLTLEDLQNRRDIPALTDQFEARGTAGLFLAGEVTGYALIRTAIAHGTAVVSEVARRVKEHRRPAADTANDPDLYDLCIVGAGPAGIAASLEAKARGLRFVTLEQNALGGTVAQYPRRKLVMTQPVSLPLYGKLKRTSYSKEELMELWSDLAERYELPIHTGVEFTGVERENDHTFLVKTKNQDYRARYVCLGLGRRGTPRKLGVPGEELSKVAYSLIDAQSYTNRRILVVGGGDSAVEAAMGLAEQPGNEVTLSYRRSSFFRLKARNEARLLEARESGKLKCILNSQLREIRPDSVRLEVTPESGEPVEQVLPNDDVFIMAGGIPPFQLLEQCGLSFDPRDRVAPPPLEERGTGLLRALIAALLLSIAVLAWVLAFRGYYASPLVQRPLSSLHEWLRPSSLFGLACGAGSVIMIVLNLSYLVRRRWLNLLPGSLAAWMSCHVVTGVLALLLVLVHAAMAPQGTLGGHAFAALILLLITGAVGRYFYSFVPRAANGKELALEELNQQIASEATEWDRLGRGFGDATRQEIHQLIAAGHWKGGFVRRLFALWTTQSAVRQACKKLRSRVQQAGLSEDQMARLVELAERAYRTALVSAHYEDLRFLLTSWRFFHRWVGLLMVLLAAWHIVTAVRYGRFLP